MPQAETQATALSILVSATEGERGLEVRCPACQHQFVIGRESLGKEMTCPQTYQLRAYSGERGLMRCGARLKVSSFVNRPC